MKKIMIYSLILLFTGFAFQSCSPSDEKIKNEVENALKSKYNTVDVGVNNGVVTLTGELMSQAERASAESVARSVKNVKSVVNNISVEEPAPVRVNTDDMIRNSLESRLNSAGYDDVKVQVINGEVILSGDLSRNDLQEVMQWANETDHVNKVTNNLTLK